MLDYVPRLGFANAMRLYSLTARALRFYEERGLVVAQRDRLNVRYYDAEARRRLDWIAPLRRAGVGLEDIREVLRLEDEQGGGLELALSAIAQRKHAIEAQLSELKEARRTLQATAMDPPRSLSAPASESRPGARA